MKQDVRALLYDKKNHTQIRRGAATDELIWARNFFSLNPGGRNMNCQKPAAVGLWSKACEHYSISTEVCCLA